MMNSSICFQEAVLLPMLGTALGGRRLFNFRRWTMFTLRINELNERIEPILRYLLDPDRWRPIGTMEPVFYDSQQMAVAEAAYQRAAHSYDPYPGAGKGPMVQYNASTGVMEPVEGPQPYEGGDLGRFYINAVTGLPYNQWTVETIGMDWGMLERVQKLMEEVLEQHTKIVAAQEKAKAELDQKLKQEKEAFQKMIQGDKGAAQPAKQDIPGKSDDPTHIPGKEGQGVFGTPHTPPGQDKPGDPKPQERK